MDVSTEEFMTLSKGLSDRDVRIAVLEQRVEQLQAKLAEQEAVNENLLRENKGLRDVNAASKLENMYLTQYIMLSVERIKSFVERLCDVDRWAFLRTFVFWSVPKELEEMEKELIEKAMEVPHAKEPSLTVQGDYLAAGDKVEQKTVIPNVGNYNARVEEQNNEFSMQPIDKEEPKLLSE